MSTQQIKLNYYDKVTELAQQGKQYQRLQKISKKNYIIRNPLLTYASSIPLLLKVISEKPSVTKYSLDAYVLIGYNN